MIKFGDLSLGLKLCIVLGVFGGIMGLITLLSGLLFALY